MGASRLSFLMFLFWGGMGGYGAVTTGEIAAPFPFFIHYSSLSPCEIVYWNSTIIIRQLFISLWRYLPFCVIHRLTKAAVSILLRRRWDCLYITVNPTSEASSKEKHTTKLIFQNKICVCQMQVNLASTFARSVLLLLAGQVGRVGKEKISENENGWLPVGYSCIDL